MNYYLKQSDFTTNQKSMILCVSKTDNRQPTTNYKDFSNFLKSVFQKTNLPNPSSPHLQVSPSPHHQFPLSLFP